MNGNGKISKFEGPRAWSYKKGTKNPQKQLFRYFLMFKEHSDQFLFALNLMSSVPSALVLPPEEEGIWRGGLETTGRE